MNIELLGYGVISGILVYQLYVTIRVAGAAEYSHRQRMVQAILIWSFPLLGAVFCHTVLYTTTDRSRPTDKKSLEDYNWDGVDGRLGGGRSGSYRRDGESGFEGGSAGADGGD